MSPTLLADAVAAGTLQADVARLDVLLNTQQARWEREAADLGFSAASLAYAFLFLFLILLGILPLFYFKGYQGPMFTACYWYLLIQYGKIVRQRFEVRRAAIQAAFEARMHYSRGEAPSRPLAQPHLCTGCGALVRGGEKCGYCDSPT